jgi:flavin-dependent dehydrogenase
VSIVGGGPAGLMAAEVLLQAGSTVLQPPMVKHREVEHSDDLELIEITAPAEFETMLVEGPG